MENKEKEKKSNGGLIVIIIILLLICCTLGGLIFLNKEKIFSEKNSATNKETQKNTSSNKEKEDLDINDSTVINLFNIFRINQGCWLSTNYEKLNTDNKYKLRLAYEHLDIEANYIPCSRVGGKLNDLYCGDGNTWHNIPEINDAYVNNKDRFYQLIELNSNTRSINQKDLKAKYIELFGSDSEYTDTDFGLGSTAETSCFTMHYIESEKIYAQYSGECGGTCAATKQEVTKAYKDNNKLYIETSYEQDITIKYEFKKDSKNDNYIFVKLSRV